MGSPKTLPPTLPSPVACTSSPYYFASYGEFVPNRLLLLRLFPSQCPPRWPNLLWPWRPPIQIVGHPFWAVVANCKAERIWRWRRMGPDGRSKNWKGSDFYAQKWSVKHLRPTLYSTVIKVEGGEGMNWMKGNHWWLLNFGWWLSFPIFNFEDGNLAKNNWVSGFSFFSHSSTIKHPIREVDMLFESHKCPLKSGPY